MATSKPSANIFGTFLENVSPDPSKSTVDFGQITKQAIDWSNKHDTFNPAPAPAVGSGSSAIPVTSPIPVMEVLKFIDDAGTPQSLASIVKKTALSVDVVTAVLRDASFAGLLVQNTAGENVTFALTSQGRGMLH